jgi:hypothetical protein
LGLSILFAGDHERLQTTPIKYIVSPHWEGNQSSVITLNVPTDEIFGKQVMLLDCILLDLKQRAIIRSNKEQVSVFLYTFDAEMKPRSLSAEERDAFWLMVRRHNDAVGTAQNWGSFPSELSSLLMGYLFVLHLSKKSCKL